MDAATTLCEFQLGANMRLSGYFTWVYLLVHTTLQIICSGSMKYQDVSHPVIVWMP